MIKDLVVAAWTRAVEGGWEEELKTLSPFALAVDLHDKDADIEKVNFGQLLPVVVDFVNNGYK